MQRATATTASEPTGRPLRLAYLGTPAVAVEPLEAIVAAGHDVAIAVTNADRRRGRGSQLVPAPVKAAAQSLRIPVTDRVDDILAVDPPVELGVVVAFGRLIRPHVLDAVPMVNLHFSALPRWRGAAPVERAVLVGDGRTAACVMEVAVELDAGGVYACEELTIDPDETVDELRARLVRSGSRLLVDLLAGGLPLPEPAPQQGEVVYAHKIDPAELHIDWDRPAEEIHRLVRVGGAWTTHDGRRIKVWRTAVPPRGAGPVVPAGDGVVELVEVQPEGKARMAGRAWANGAHWSDGQRLGQ